MSPSHPSPRLALIIAYDGSSYSGWQRQPHHPSIQASIETSLHHISQQQVTIHGSGRTDSGVHAHGQVAHFDPPATRANMQPENWKNALNQQLPEQIRILQVHPVAANFHARFSAESKTYHYQLWHHPAAHPLHRHTHWQPRGSLQLSLLQEALHQLQGRHDFAAFAANRADGSDPQRGSASTRTLHQAELIQAQHSAHIQLRADGFHYRMARLLVGASIQVARQKLSLSQLRALLDQNPDQPLTKSPLCAPAHGLSLQRVHYPKPHHLPHPWDLQAATE